VARPRPAARKKLRVLLVFDMPYAVSRTHDYTEEFADPENCYTENDVHQALLANGYDVRLLGLYADVRPLLEEVREFRPDVIFNLMETFHQVTRWDKNITALIEVLGVPYTGATSAALFLCNDKGLSRKILRFHRVRGPRFHTFYRGQRVWLPETIGLPCIVKPLTEEASRGISNASIVDDEESFVERVQMIQRRMKLDAIAEEYVEGRELYVSLIGDQKLRVLPPREMTFGQLPEDEPRIATYKAKWDEGYRKRWGIRNVFATKLPPVVRERIEETCKRAYRALNLRSYARFDLRVTATGQVYVIEPNVNPCLARDDELAQSALRVGIPYPALIRAIVNQALRRRS
jgi:D-alanine-D-alanine ligase